MVTQLILLIAFFLVASMAYAAWRGAPWVPTWKRDVLRIEKLANLQPGDRFVELGCGSANVLRYLAKHSNAEIVGVELSLIQWIVASILVFAPFSISPRPRIILADAFHHDLSSYTVVYMFLMPETYKKISPKLLSELKPGTRVITYVWPIPGWETKTVDHIEGAPDLFLYTV